MRQHLPAAKICQELLYVKSSEFDWNGHGQKSAQRSGGRDRSRTPSGDGGHRLFGFGKHKGRAFEDVYRKERDYVKWVQRIPRPTSGLAEFKRFIRQPKSKAVERPEQERDCKGKQLAKADLLGFLKTKSTSKTVVAHVGRTSKQLRLPTLRVRRRSRELTLPTLIVRSRCCMLRPHLITPHDQTSWGAAEGEVRFPATTRHCHLC